jgi:hypothetical protein
MVGRFLRLPAHDRALLFSAMRLVLFIRAALWVFPYRVVRQRLLQHRASKTQNSDCLRIAWAVSAVSRYIPGATCLTQALAADDLLRTYGYEPSIHIGVARNRQKVLEAHAWVEIQGRIILGNAGVERFTPLQRESGGVI